MKNAEMKNTPEHRVDRVLRALGNSVPPAGMEERISSALRQAAAGREVRASGHVAPWWTRARRWLIAVPALAALLVMLWWGSGSRPDRAHLQPGTLKNHPPIDASMTAAAVKESVRRVPIRNARVTGRSGTAAVSVGRARLATTASGGSSARDASAVREPGFPAPPLPVTEQERLLLKLAHRNDPELLASLTLEAREAEQRREREEVRRFFAPQPSPPEQAGQP